MKKVIAAILSVMMLFCSALAAEQPALEIRAQFTDNQKALYSVLDEFEEEIQAVLDASL